MFEVIAECLEITSFAFPDHQDIPSGHLQSRVHRMVPRYVLIKLLLPELNSRLRVVRVLAAGVPVPEAAMNEHNGSILRKNDVGPTREVLTMKPEPVAERM